MSTVSGKHWYRFNFLKSEEWKTFRSQVLLDNECRCWICQFQDVSSDVHHVWYGEPSYTGARQFVILCRTCHTAVHRLFKPDGAKTEKDRQDAWFSLQRCRSILLGNLPSTDPTIKPVPRPIKPRVVRARCAGCYANNPVDVLFNPIKQTLSSIEDKMAMNLCPECIDILKASLPPREHGTSAIWKDIKAVLNLIPKKNLTPPDTCPSFNPS